MRLLAGTAEGRLVPTLAAEGGLDSVLWAGPENFSDGMRAGVEPVQGTLRKNPVALKLGFSGEPFSYCLDLGLPKPSSSMFHRDPEMKRECLWRGIAMDAKSLCADRSRGGLRCRSEKGRWQDIEIRLPGQSSMLAEYLDPYCAPEIIVAKELLRSWRFYDSFRTDSGAPARQTSPGTFTPVLSDDGVDFAAALQTIREIGRCEELDMLVDSAFPGTEVSIENTTAGIQLSLLQPGMLRELTVAELSDGTLRYLLLAAALLSPRPPTLLVLNEPENSLHPDIIPALGQLIIHASQHSQVIVVTHSRALQAILAEHEDCRTHRLIKELGETKLEDAETLDQLSWKWPSR